MPARSNWSARRSREDRRSDLDAAGRSGRVRPSSNRREPVRRRHGRRTDRRPHAEAGLEIMNTAPKLTDDAAPKPWFPTETNVCVMGLGYIGLAHRQRPGHQGLSRLRHGRASGRGRHDQRRADPHRRARPGHRRPFGRQQRTAEGRIRTAAGGRLHAVRAHADSSRSLARPVLRRAGGPGDSAARASPAT